ncbi:GNAT family N-acetyltransferase [Fibrobacter sp. UWEL]|uniref:GNAT family N-acetyltransferase n=1 Tax=Fibrobacter sp. UWEL TaxID=1896209 RepID=UPI00091DCBB0|nr:GNAT family protein [Fibrobacter sp. UWEL]SHL08955.1 ribosomal-protein-serine acetyltransferase [Fibrobacter sp. UWEL]
MNPADDSFEEFFTQAFSTETLEGGCCRLVGISLSDLRETECCDESRGMGHRENRPMSPEAVFQLVRNSEDFLAEHLPWVRGVTVPEIAKRMRSWIFAEQYGQGGCWGIFPKVPATEPTCGKSDELAGFIMAEFNLKNHSAALSYWLSKDYTGRGLMTDAVRTLSRYCFVVLKLNRLELSVSVTNEKSRALATRCGFLEEGISRDFERINGIFVNHCRFSRLARDE